MDFTHIPGQVPQLIDRDAPIFTVSVAAELAGMHPQTLRTYDRLGLVVPHRGKGRGRRYTMRNVSQLRLVQHLSQDEGINLNGIRRILELNAELEDAKARVEQLTELLRELASSAQQAPRVFTASMAGDIHAGRRVVVQHPRALTAG